MYIEGINFYQKALFIDKYDEEIHLGLIQVYQAMGDKKLAQTQKQKT
jgi:two-component SAPR family response regulator